MPDQHIVDIADILPPSHHQPAQHVPTGPHATFSSRDGLSAFASQGQFSQATTISMRDSAKRILLTVWTKDGIEIQVDASRQKHTINPLDVVLTLIPDNVTHTHFLGHNQHVGLVLELHTLEQLDESAAQHIQTALAQRGGLCIQPARAQLLRSAHELQETLNHTASSPLLRHAKCLEFLAHSLEPWQTKNSHPSASFNGRQQAKLRQAREHLLHDLANAPDISTLARLCAINTFELKRGFREVFGMSIYALYQQERLNRAWQLIHTGEMTAQEAGQTVGYRNMSHFGCAFKRQFGVLPGQLRRQVTVAVAKRE